jgi:rhodanese-related sulfurtransferase
MTADHPQQAASGGKERAMCKVLIRALILVGLGVGIGIVHAQIGERAKPRLTAAELGTGEPKPGPDGASAAPAQAPAEPIKASPAAQPDSGRAAAPQPAPVNPPASAVKEPEVGHFISLQQAKELFDRKAHGSWDGIFIDARPYHEFTAGHIPGSMHIDKKYFDGKVPSKIKDYLPGTEVVIYCHGEQCTDSEAVATRLVALKLQIGPIKIIKEGFPGWQSAGFPVDTGGEVGFQ